MLTTQQKLDLYIELIDKKHNELWESACVFKANGHFKKYCNYARILKKNKKRYNS